MLFWQRLIWLSPLSLFHENHKFCMLRGKHCVCIYIYIFIYLFIYGSYRRDSAGKMYVRYEVIGASSVAVPTHFFKVIVAETADQKYDMEAYVMPNEVINDSTPLNVFQVCGTQLWLCKLSDCDTSHVKVYIHENYFVWQLCVVTSCWILYCINIAHSVSCPQAGLGSGQSDEQQLSKWWPCT